MEMDRRSFVSGAAGLGALAAMAGLVGCGSPSKASDKSKDADAANSKSYLNPGDYTVGETKDYEVVIVGAGGAGMCSAVRASELGLKAVLLEQHPRTGGTSEYTEGLFAINSHIQKENGKNPPDLGYDLFTAAMDYHHWYANGQLFRSYIDASGDNIAWLEDSCGVVFQGTGSMCGNEYNTWHQYKYNPGEVSGAPYVASLTAAVEASSTDLVCSSKAIDLVMENGKVVGIVAKEGSNYVQYNASKGVVLCTGGYADNPDMIHEFGKNPDRILAMGAGDRDGFGINACREAGATLAPGPGCIVPYGGTIPGVAYGTHLYCATAFQPYFWINENCERFVNEYYAERNFSWSGDAQSMQDRVISILTQEQLDRMHEQGGTFGCGEYVHAGVPLTDLWDEFNQLKDGGNSAVHGPMATVADMAEELGLDADKLQKSIDTYNGYVDAGVDPEFGKAAEYLEPSRMNDGPWYAFELQVGIFTTVGGIKINNKAQVLAEDGTVIPNLYACGCDAGGIYGDAYDVSICEGSCQGFAVYTGKLAAETIAELNA